MLYQVCIHARMQHSFVRVSIVMLFTCICLCPNAFNCCTGWIMRQGCSALGAPMLFRCHRRPLPPKVTMN